MADREELIERLEKRANKWRGNEDGSPVAIKLGDLKAIIAALRAQPAGVKVRDNELRRYIDKCTEMANGGEYAWWSRLAEILSALEPAALSKQEAVAWTGSGSLSALANGNYGHIWPSKADAHPIPLYASPVPAEPSDRPTGHVEIPHDGFAGDIIGHYLTREGKPGVVVQQDGTRVVHVYGEKWLLPISPDKGGEGNG